MATASRACTSGTVTGTAIPIATADGVTSTGSNSSAVAAVQEVN